MADDEIALNTWAAEDLGVEPGAEVEITYFEPESTHAEVRESKHTFRLKAIVAISGAAADKNLTPQMPGVTDRLTIGDWDAPFPFEPGRVRKKDETYWDEYRTTPKAFVSLAAGRRMWSSRFGDTTAVRLVPPAGQTAATLPARLHLDPADFGFRFMSVKRLGLAAASGTTPFNALFVGFSLFIMVSALLLVALLFRLGIEQRVAEIGILRAVGIGRRRVALALAGEGFLVAVVGSAVGAAAGVGYAALMLAGLTSWWLSAISTPFLELFVRPASLAIGFASGGLVSLLTILWTLRRLGRLSVRRLLARQTAEDRFAAPRTTRKSKIVAGVLAVAAVGLGLSAGAGGRSAGRGVRRLRRLVLAAGLLYIWARLRGDAIAPFSTSQSMPIARLAAHNGARNPSRSTLSIGLVGAASFLIVALSAFRLDPAAEGRGRASGSGGFNVVAQSDLPIYQDLATTKGRSELGLPAKADAELAKCDIVAMRVRAGDDASCLNLYQPTDPRMLGASDALIERGGFAWASSAAESPAEKENPWLLLDRSLPDDADGTPVVPAVVDFNTAEYSLHKGALGQSIDVTDGNGRTLRLKFVGFLKNSIFQGDVIVRDRQLVRALSARQRLPFFSGRYARPARGPNRTSTRRPVGRFRLGRRDQCRTAGGFLRRAEHLSVDVSEFGRARLAAGDVRTGDRAIAQCAGAARRVGADAGRRFSPALLARLVMLENALLLVAGLGVGLVAALVAVLPYWLSGGATVPWLSLGATLALVLVVGLLAGLAAVRATLSAELIPALRDE